MTTNPKTGSSPGPLKGYGADLQTEESKIMMEMIKERKSKRGGKREGAGRKKGKILNDSMRRRRHTVRLPGWLIDWLRAQPGSKGQLIESAIVKRHAINIQRYLLLNDEPGYKGWKYVQKKHNILF